MKRLIYIIAAGFLLFHCGSPTAPDNSGTAGNTVEELLNSGWSEFEKFNYQEAKAYFDQALAKEPENSDANLGKGWTLLLEGSNHYQLAIIAFENAMKNSDCEADCKAGTIVAKFNQERFDEIASLVDYFLQSYPKYEFNHNSKIDWIDLLLMKAQSQYFTRHYSASWTTLKKITSEFNDIDPQASATWVINEQIYFSFEAVLSKIIYILTETYK